MKPRLAEAFILSILFAAMMIPAQAQGTAKKLNLTMLDGVPDGNYLVTLEINGKEERMNFEIKDNKAKCVNASNPIYKTVQGRFEAWKQQPGAFVGRFEGDNNFRTTQLWILRSDGSAAIREAPDRGEQQSAVPVKGNTLEGPKKK